MPAGKTREEYNEYMRQYMKGWYDRRRAQAIVYLGGKCVRCGSAENLQFDHIDPSTKVAALSSLWTASEERFQAELKKCQLLCENCHLAKTVEEKLKSGRKVNHGGGLTGKRNCYCPLCKPLKTAYAADRKARIAGQTEIS
jgi:5-methylcytosine-specific restriction endonuclease McrA